MDAESAGASLPAPAESALSDEAARTAASGVEACGSVS